MLRVLLATLAGIACLVPTPSSAAAPAAHHVIATIPVGSSPAWLAFDQRTGSMYVANIFSDDVSVIDGRNLTVSSTVPLPGGNACAHPFGIGYVPRTGEVYVACPTCRRTTSCSARAETFGRVAMPSEGVA